MDDKQFIFIAGLHRSGTSLLHEILRSHPEISGFTNTGASEDEGQHLQTVYPTARYYGGPGRFGFDPRSYMDESHPLAVSQSSERLIAEWSTHWDLSKSHLIEKSPPNIVRTRFLQALFPESRFLIILRHPVAVAYATRRWCNTSMVSLLDHTLRCYEQFFRDRPYLRSSYVLKYEEFVHSPQESISSVFDWIGVRPYQFSNEVRREVNREYFSRWDADRHSVWSRSFGWHRGMWMKLRDLERRASALGYNLKTPEELLPVDWPLKVEP